MEQVQFCESTEFGAIRMVDDNGKILFCGKDVASALGYVNTVKALGDHCREDGVTIRDLTDSLGRTQQAKFIDEGNLYRLIVHSKLPTAERFERWVFDEVLPAIRRNGSYSMRPAADFAARPLTTDDYMAAARIVANCRNERLPVVLHLLEQGGMNVGQIPQQIDRTDTERAYRCVMDCVRENAAHFDGTAGAEVWGAVRGAFILVDAQQMRRLLLQNGMNFDKVKRGLRDSGYLVTTPDGRYANNTVCRDRKTRYVIIKTETEEISNV